jgi:hypothetical protein
MGASGGWIRKEVDIFNQWRIGGGFGAALFHYRCIATGADTRVRLRP